MLPSRPLATTSLAALSFLLLAGSAFAADPVPVSPAPPTPQAAPPPQPEPARTEAAKAEPAKIEAPKTDAPSVGAASNGAARPSTSVIAQSALLTDDEPDSERFKVDPIADGALIVMGLGFAGTNELILSTGEIRPQQPGDSSRLLGIDHGAITQTIDPNAGTISNIGLYMAVAFAVFDPIFSGVRDGADAALVDAVLYAETLSLTLTLTDVAKLAVRRPRPNAYIEQAKLDAQYGADKAPAITDTDSSLSFFSGHAAICAATSATATYLAFSRSPHSWRPWVTLAAGVLLTSGVSFERVRAGAHFPTDVIAGAVAGAGIGVLVPHLHRHDTAPKVWIGFAPTTGTGGMATLQGLF